MKNNNIKKKKKIKFIEFVSDFFRDMFIFSVIYGLVALGWVVNEYLGYFATVIGVLVGLVLLGTDDKDEEEQS